MIIARSPLRLSLGGGGTDLPSYYERFGGFVIAGAIDKFVDVTVHQTTKPHFILRYSKIEEVDHRDKISHPIIREALRHLDIQDRNLEITSIADLPSGTGLGSSGSFTTALLKALHRYDRSFIHPRELAELACRLEIDVLREPIGKQDQYAASFGGITAFDYQRDGSVRARPIKMSEASLHELEENLVLFSTGQFRSASEVLKDQKEKTLQDSEDMINNLHKIKEIGLETAEVLEAGKLDRFAELMHEHWLMKRKRSKGITNPQIDEWYDLAISNGAQGGKVVGAGGGGFLLFYTEKKSHLRKALRGAGLQEVLFRFEFDGTRLV